MCKALFPEKHSNYIMTQNSFLALSHAIAIKSCKNNPIQRYMARFMKFISETNRMIIAGIWQKLNNLNVRHVRKGPSDTTVRQSAQIF